MKVINKIDNPDAKFCLYFLAFDGPNSVSHGKHWTDREGIIELTYVPVLPSISNVVLTPCQPQLRHRGQGWPSLPQWKRRATRIWTRLYLR